MRSTPVPSSCATISPARCTPTRRMQLCSSTRTTASSSSKASSQSTTCVTKPIGSRRKATPHRHKAWQPHCAHFRPCQHCHLVYALLRRWYRGDLQQVPRLPGFSRTSPSASHREFEDLTLE